MNPPALNPSNQLIEATSRAVVTPSNKSTLPNTNNIELSPALIKALQPPSAPPQETANIFSRNLPKGLCHNPTKPSQYEILLLLGQAISVY
jgi:hypothetical protein